MTNRSPAFQFYPSDFLSDENVISMTFEERGIYITLLCSCWIQGSIPADPDKIKRLLPGYNGDGIPEQVMECFIPMEDNPGRLVHNRLEKERLKQGAWKEKCSAGGRKSAEIRQKKQELKGSSRVLEDNLEVKSNTMSSSSSLSSSSKQEQDALWKIEKSQAFEKAWSSYPGKKDGKKGSIGHWNASIKKSEDLGRYQDAIDNYSETVRLERLTGFPTLNFKHAKTWFNNWQDYIPAKEPTVVEEPLEPAKPRVRGDPETEKLWEDVLEKIKGTVSPGAFGNWFKGTYPKGFIDGRLVIAVSDQVNRNCLIENYTLQIEGVLQGLREKPILVDFCIDRQIV